MSEREKKKTVEENHFRWWRFMLHTHMHIFLLWIEHIWIICELYWTMTYKSFANRFIFSLYILLSVCHYFVFFSSVFISFHVIFIGFFCALQLIYLKSSFVWCACVIQNQTNRVSQWKLNIRNMVYLFIDICNCTFFFNWVTNASFPCVVVHKILQR